MKNTRIAVAAFAGVAGLALTTACGSGGGGTVGSGEMPAEIKVVSVTDKTGLTAFGGLFVYMGYTDDATWVMVSGAIATMIGFAWSWMAKA